MKGRMPAVTKKHGETHGFVVGLSIEGIVIRSDVPSLSRWAITNSLFGSLIDLLWGHKDRGLDID